MQFPLNFKSFVAHVSVKSAVSFGSAETLPQLNVGSQLGSWVLMPVFCADALSPGLNLQEVLESFSVLLIKIQSCYCSTFQRLERFSKSSSFSTFRSCFFSTYVRNMADHSHLSLTRPIRFLDSSISFSSPLIFSFPLLIDSSSFPNFSFSSFLIYHISFKILEVAVRFPTIAATSGWNKQTNSSDSLGLEKLIERSI